MEENKVEKVVEVATEQPAVDETVETLKVKKPQNKKFKEPEDNVFKVNLDKPSQETTVEEPVKVVEEVVENVVEEQKETPIMEEVTEEEVAESEDIEETVESVIEEPVELKQELPENIEKLMSFMEETGGDLSDYVKLNQDYSSLGEEDLLYEYYKQTKPHLNQEEINFLMEDQFSYDEEIEEERDIKRKKLALKEQVAQAKHHLDGAKSKYYEDIKAGSKLTNEQQKAIDFFNKHNEGLEKTQKAAKDNSDIFSQETNKVFNDKFKGFEYNVGDKKYRVNVSNADEVKNNQSDLNNFTKKFLDKNMGLKDAAGYHKSLYTAMNADSVAKHFYEQGRADAVKDSVARSKNINMDPRQGHTEIQTSDVKARVIGDSSSDFKFKIKNNKFKN